MPRALREYFLDPCAPLPDAVSIYYWTYPSRRVVIARAIAKTNIRFSPVIIGDILKFYPLGYWVVWDAPPLRTDALAPLVLNRAEGVDFELDPPIRFRRQPPLDFPGRERRSGRAAPSTGFASPSEAGRRDTSLRSARPRPMSGPVVHCLRASRAGGA